MVDSDHQCARIALGRGPDDVALLVGVAEAIQTQVAAAVSREHSRPISEFCNGTNFHRLKIPQFGRSFRRHVMSDLGQFAQIAA